EAGPDGTIDPDIAGRRGDETEPPVHARDFGVTTAEHENPEWIAVGRLRRTRGNRGEFLAEIYSNKAGRAGELRQVILEAGTERREVTIEKVWYHDGVPVLKFAGIDSISAAEPW